MAEKEADHRHEMERTVLESNRAASDKEFAERRLGQIFAFILALSAIVGGVVLAIKGVEGWGGVLSFTGIAVLAAVFVTTRRSKGPDT